MASCCRWKSSGAWRQPAAERFIGAILWAIVHFISGGLLHAIVALGSGAMFSFVYLRYRGPSVAVAYATTAFARACNNIAILIAVFYGLDT